jgi:hypothetical protein
MPHSKEKVRARILEALGALTEDERGLFGDVMKLEAENLHLKKPHIREDLVRTVKQVIK